VPQVRLSVPGPKTFFFECFYQIARPSLQRKKKAVGGFAIFFGPGPGFPARGTTQGDTLVGKPTLFWLDEEFDCLQERAGDRISALCSNRGSGFLTIGFSLDEDGSHTHSLAGLDV
jgi:hypothetical protein